MIKTQGQGSGKRTVINRSPAQTRSMNRNRNLHERNASTNAQL